MILRGDVASDMLAAHTGLNMVIPDRAEGPFRVCYLLHGLHGNQDTWLDNTMLPVFAKEYGAVFVMPGGGRSFYRDMRYGHRYFSYITEELPALCGRILNISSAREDTAIMGCSMGGYGSLTAALSLPERFGFCGAISSAFLFPTEALRGVRSRSEAWIRQQAPEMVRLYEDFKCIFGEELEPGPRDDPAELVRRLSEGPQKPVIYAACGEGDEFFAENLRFKGELEKYRFDFTWEAWPGLHDWVFFNEALQRGLRKWVGPAGGKTG
jgi:S-formylglutathione hydrolase FrmB